MTDRRNLPKRLHHSDLVVHGHDRRDQRHVVDRVFQAIEIHEPIRPHLKNDHLESQATQILNSLKDRGVFRGDGDDPPAFLRGSLGHTP